MVFGYGIAGRFIFDWIKIFIEDYGIFLIDKKLNVATSFLSAFGLLLVAPIASTSAQVDYVMTGEWLTPCDSSDMTRECTISNLRPFVYPTGIAIDSSNNVYVVDAWTKEVQKFTSNGDFIMKWGTPGNGDGQFRTPTGIAIDSSNNVYVIDSSLSNVQKFTSNGDFIMKWGTPGNGDGQFRTPTGIAIDSSNNVYVLHLGLVNVQKFTSDGEFIMKWGTLGTHDGEFRHPVGIAVDPSSNVYIVDQKNNRIQKFTSDGGFLTKWGTRCEPKGNPYVIMDSELYSCIQPQDNEFFYPNGGIAVDEFSNVYVIDQYNNRIQKFTTNGKFISTILLPDYRAIVPSYSMLGHSDIDVDHQGHKIFTTVLDDKILVFSKVCSDLGKRIC
ncbi:MAG: 6-bladed beta-propeller [Nitrososphaeraceae archaeon]